MAERSGLTILWMVIWALLLFFIAFWIAGTVAFFYIILYIFVPCIPALKDFLDVLHKGLLLPYYCSDNFMNGRDIPEGLNFIVSGGTAS